LNNFFLVLILLHRSVTGEVLFECLAYSLNIEILREPSYGCNALSPVTLLNTDVNLVALGCPRLVSSVLECVCGKTS
jgi:hypothetical protein